MKTHMICMLSLKNSITELWSLPFVSEPGARLITPLWLLLFDWKTADLEANEE